MSRSSKLLLISFILDWFASSLLGPIYALFVRNIGGDILEAGISYGIYMLVSGIFVFTLGRTDFFHRNLRPFVVAGYILLTIAQAGYLLVGNTFELFMVQIVLGVGVGILEPSWDAIYAANLDEKQAASHWSLWAGSRDIVAGVAAFVGGAIVALYSFQVLFIIMAILNIIGIAVILNILKDHRRVIDI